MPDRSTWGESRERLGWHLWVIERTPARLSRFRRLAIRCQRRADILQEAA